MCDVRSRSCKGRRREKVRWIRAGGLWSKDLYRAPSIIETGHSTRQGLKAGNPRLRGKAIMRLGFEKMKIERFESAYLVEAVSGFGSFMWKLHCELENDSLRQAPFRRQLAGRTGWVG